ncbi:hypothetical protein NKG94_04195 [Micromonospora sp. M12]
MDARQHADALVPTIAFGVVGICTFAVYIMMLRRQIIEKVPAIPVLALCANISWRSRTPSSIRSTRRCVSRSTSGSRSTW